MNQYYYIGPNNQQLGPLPVEELVKVINSDTMVWAQGMDNWAPASSVSELSQLLAAREQVPPFNGGQQVPPYQGQQNQFGGNYGSSNQYQNNFNGGVPPRPNSYLVWAILSIICCCWPLGVVAVVFASKVNGLYEQGLYEEARKASENAKTWSIVSAVLGFLTSGAYLVYLLKYGLTALG